MAYDLKAESRITLTIGNETFTLVPKTRPPGCVIRPASRRWWPPCRVVPT